MTDKLFPFLCFSVFFVVTINELLNDPSTPPDKQIPEMKSSLALSPAGKLVLTIQYCHSCGYHKAFMEYAEILQQKYPDLIIDGSYYDPTGFNYFCAKALSFGKIFIIFLIIMSKNLFTMLGRPEPRIWSWCVNNRLYACLTIFFVCNMLESMIISTGAFEMSLNGIPLWSKLETNRIPQPYELFSIIDNQFPRFAEQTTFNYDANVLPKHSS